MKQLMLTFVFFSLINRSHGQVGIGTTDPHESAQLQVHATNKGFLPPRLSTFQKLNIANPAGGLLVYDYQQEALNIYSPLRGWEKVLTPVSGAYSRPTDVSTDVAAAGNNYGFSVSIGAAVTNGGMAVVGAPGSNNKEGMAELLGFHQPTGKPVRRAIYNPSDLLPGDQFGYAVAADRLNTSNEVAIAAPFSAENGLANAGSVYFYTVSTLKNQVQAPAVRQVANAKFGRSVDIAGNTTLGKGFAIVGAPGANANKGEAYIYEYNPNSLVWEHRATLSDNLGAAADSFGLSVAIHYKANADTGWAFVGAPYDDEGALANAGSVTAFRKAAGSSLWTRVGKFTATSVNNEGLYGYALAPLMSCGKLLVTAPYMGGALFEASLTSLAGNVATFSNSTLPMIYGSATSARPGVGVSVSAMTVNFDCNNIIAAAGSGTGSLTVNSSVYYGTVSTYYFDGTAWNMQEEQMVDANELQIGALFGKAVSIDGQRKTIIVGSPNQNVNGNAAQGKVQARGVFE